jgi:hypothetical protein
MQRNHHVTSQTTQDPADTTRDIEPPGMRNHHALLTPNPKTAALIADEDVDGDSLVALRTRANNPFLTISAWRRRN